MLFDFMKLNPNFVLEGIDISDYAITNAVPEVKKFLKIVLVRSPRLCH